jgi:hypothetical protein
MNSASEVQDILFPEIKGNGQTKTKTRLFDYFTNYISRGPTREQKGKGARKITPKEQLEMQSDLWIHANITLLKKLGSQLVNDRVALFAVSQNLNVTRIVGEKTDKKELEYTEEEQDLKKTHKENIEKHLLQVTVKYNQLVEFFFDFLDIPHPDPREVEDFVTDDLLEIFLLTEQEKKGVELLESQKE